MPSQVLAWPARLLLRREQAPDQPSEDPVLLNHSPAYSTTFALMLRVRTDRAQLRFAPTGSPPGAGQAAHGESR